MTNKKLKPCPFCGREIFNHFGDKAIMHKQGCPMLNGAAEYIKLLSTYELENWNTRATQSVDSDWVSVEDRLPETQKGFSKYSLIPVWILDEKENVVEGDFRPEDIFMDDFGEEVVDVVMWHYRLPPQPPTENKGE